MKGMHTVVEIARIYSIDMAIVSYRRGEDKRAVALAWSNFEHFGSGRDCPYVSNDVHSVGELGTMDGGTVFGSM